MYQSPTQILAKLLVAVRQLTHLGALTDGVKVHIVVRELHVKLSTMRT